jgi:hypothetical protein
MDNRIAINMSSVKFHIMDHTEEIMLSYHLVTHILKIQMLDVNCYDLCSISPNVKESVHAFGYELMYITCIGLVNLYKTLFSQPKIQLVNKI